MNLHCLNYISLDMNEIRVLTKAICNKGFSGKSNILPRCNFCVGGQESSPKSLTAYSLKRYVQQYEEQ